MKEDKLRKVIEAAKLYYQLDHSQSEIAERLGVSRPTVSRLLQQAKSEGIVQITIIDPMEEIESLAADLRDKFQLKQVEVAFIPYNENDIGKKYIGEAAANYIDRIVKDNDIIAVSWGTTLYQVARQIQRKTVKNVVVVQLNGGVSYSEVNTYASEIIQLFGNAFHVNPHFLNLPAIVDHILVKQAIQSDRHIRKVLDLGKQSNIAIFTAGVPNSESVLIQTNYFTNEEIEVIKSHAVGDICSRYFDMNGVICLENLDDRTIGIELAELRGKEHSILVAGGTSKVEAIYGALCGKYANTLITDQFTAKALLNK
ncbi:MAG: sugar-binding transcriptional regulator [Paenibacillaceae bacterium]